MNMDSQFSLVDVCDILETPEPGQVDVGLFLETIQNYNYLYDLESPKYKDRKLKARAWEEIAEIFNCSVEELQKLWKSLRDRFVKEKNKSKPSGSQAPESSWEYFHQIIFYAKYTKSRKTFTNTKQQDKSQQHSDSRPSSGASVWSTVDTLLSPSQNLVEDSGTTQMPDTTPKTDRGSMPGGRIRKIQQNSDIEDVLQTAKEICSSLSARDEKPTVNTKFAEYVAFRLNEMSLEEAKERRKEMLLILER